MEGYMLKIPLLTGCGLFDFKIKYGTSSISEPREVASYEIELPVEDGGISYVDNAAYSILANRFLCAKPGQVRMTEAPFRCYYIHLYPDAGELCQVLSSLPTSIPVKNPQPYIDLFYELIAAQNGEYRFGKFAMAHSLLKLIHMLCTEATDNKMLVRTGGSQSSRNAIQDSLLWIDGHLSEKITLEKVSREVYLSPIYFRNLFEKTVGMSPNIYVQKRRVERAKQMLSTTDKSLAEIADHCGFSSQAYFGKVFKSSTGLSPNAYRTAANNLYP